MDHFCRIVFLSDSLLASYDFYRETAARLGFEEVQIVDMSEHLAIHYSRVLDELEKRRDELSSIISQDYIERAIVGLNHWIEAGENNHLTWGILHFYKR